MRLMEPALSQLAAADISEAVGEPKSSKK
jgi:hypothetical protein